MQVSIPVVALAPRRGLLTVSKADQQQWLGQHALDTAQVLDLLPPWDICEQEVERS